MQARNIHCDSTLLDLIRGMTHPDPNARLNIDQIMQHPWMAGETAT
jgi:serine/threonine protein kinase